MDLLKSVNKNLLIVCGIAAAIGLLILIAARPIMFVVCFLAALCLIAVGVLRIMTYTKEKKHKPSVPNLAIGLFLILAGIIFAVESSLLVVIMPYLLCIVIWFGALYLVQRTLEVFIDKMEDWWIIGVIAFVAFVLALLTTIYLKNNMWFAIDATVKSKTMWLTGLSLMLVSGGVIASDIVVRMKKA